MKTYIVTIIGIVSVVASFVWMVLSKASTGLFLVLAAISVVIIEEEIDRIKKEKNDE